MDFQILYGRARHTFTVQEVHQLDLIHSKKKD
jgi:hypothetical protein